MISTTEIYQCPTYKVLYLPIRNIKKENVGWAIASLEDYDKLSLYNYHLYKRRDGKFYVYCTINRKEVSIHELIMGKAPEGYVIDHINSNGLDNRRCNLRFATLSQNSQNRIKEEGKYSSDYTGVTFCKIEKNYRSTISYKSKYMHIGRYKTELGAARAYDIYAVHYYGVHSKTNKLLSDIEIENILTIGIPDSYKKKIKDLPKNIYRKGNRFCYQVSKNGQRFYKSFDTIEETVEARNELVKSLLEKREQEITSNIGNITRNNDNIAVIYLRNKNNVIIGECLVDDNVWYDLSIYKWCLRGDEYSSGYINKTNILMHIYLYKKYKGNIPKKHNIDHINQIPLDNRLDNLRVANPSLQSHNQKKVEGSICKYKGVTINGNKFVVNSYGQRSSFEYMEDAARKYNELAMGKYGENANLNEVSDTQTKVQDLIPDNITEEYIKGIQFAELFRQVVKKKGWGGRNGYFNTKKIKITTLDENKKKAIGLLSKGY